MPGVPAPTRNAAGPYPNADKSGKQAAYVVDDVATETVSQAITVAKAGVCEVGFDLLATTSGAASPNDAAFTATAAGVTILQANASTIAVNTWTHYAANANLPSPGPYVFQFALSGGAAPAKGMVVKIKFAISPPHCPGPASTCRVPNLSRSQWSPPPSLAPGCCAAGSDPVRRAGSARVARRGM